ncbi:hypothetical protein [Clostridium pasteurianum]|uniref:Uncharacterized protein n=1 Tax=Clostridium pasteurianum BC1 TaxID=86416 RepID=R4K431_CLOPA|nr:hypothetical protein [Clostridium pasteurianum]AGK97897.1 hypothetical protein Clopa_3072 [Clostridium pasteurianum BC1]
MILSNRKFYIVKQSDNTTWNFFYNKDGDIVYKFFKNNIWSDYHILVKKALNKFSVMLLNDDSIIVLYENLSGILILSKYNGKTWDKKQIVKNTKNKFFNMYFKAVANDNKINIIYSIFNKKDKIATLFHQIIDEKNILSTPNFIDKIKCHYPITFILYSTKNQDIYIMYERLVDNYDLGYKIFNKYTNKWSDFNFIASNTSPLKDYSMLTSDDILHALYIKKEDNINSLIYVQVNNSNLKTNKLFEGKNIKICSFFIVCNQIWYYWLNDNKIYSNFSIDNGNTFSSPPFELILDSSNNIFKAGYMSNNFETINCSIVNELYIANHDLENLNFSSIYSYFKNNIDFLSYMKYYMTKVHEKNLSMEKTSEEKEQHFTELKDLLETKKSKLLYYEKKLQYVNNIYAQFKNKKKLLATNINIIQQDLINKEENLSLLEDENMKMKKEILSLKDELSNQENRIISLLGEIKILQHDNTTLNAQFTKSNSKLNISLLKKIFPNNYFFK